MPITKIENEHERLMSMLNQLLDEREILLRENEYLKAKLNESILIETIKNMKKERDLLFKLLLNLTNKDEQIPILKNFIKENHSSTLSRHNPSSTTNHARIHRLKTNIEQPSPPTTTTALVHPIKNSSGLTSSSSSSITHMKQSQTNKNILIYKTQEFNKIIQLKHSQNSPFQQYRSQSLQDLT